jgi:chlorobactene glucosyltransferase
MIAFHNLFTAPTTGISWLWLLVIGVLLVGLANVLANFGFVFWAARRAGTSQPMVSVLVPARNEQTNIESCVRSLLAQDYPNYEVIALDDDSTDATGALLDEMAKEDPRLRVLHYRDPLPAGVNGKSRACQILAAQARGDWLLFVDADTVHRPDAIRAGITRAQGLGVALLSVIPQQCMGSWGERLFVPAGFTLIYNALSCWRIYLERRPRFLNAAAIGQYLLVRREVYFACGGHNAIRSAILDDVALGKLIKRCGHRIALIDGDWVSCRMYRGFREVVEGFSKNAFAVLSSSLLLSAIFIVVCLGVFVWPLAAALASILAGQPSWPALLAIALTALNLGLVARRLGQPWWIGLLYPAHFAIGVGILLNSMRWHYTGQTRWKGRLLAASR